MTAYLNLSLALATRLGNNDMQSFSHSIKGNNNKIDFVFTRKPYVCGVTIKMGQLASGTDERNDVYEDSMV